MTLKVTVLKVCIVCDKCKVKVVKAVAKLEGVNKIETDEEKSTITVVGEVDPHAIVKCARKVGPAEIISISDPKKPEEKKPEPKKEEKKKEEKKDEKKDEAHIICTQPCYSQRCYLNYVIVPYDMPAPYSDPPPCTIM